MRWGGSFRGWVRVLGEREREEGEGRGPTHTGFTRLRITFRKG
jgi:hypothetical protein